VIWYECIGLLVTQVSSVYLVHRMAHLITGSLMYSRDAMEVDLDDPCIIELCRKVHQALLNAQRNNWDPMMCDSIGRHLTWYLHRFMERWSDDLRDAHQMLHFLQIRVTVMMLQNVSTYGVLRGRATVTVDLGHVQAVLYDLDEFMFCTGHSHTDPLRFLCDVLFGHQLKQVARDSPDILQFLSEIDRWRTLISDARQSGQLLKDVYVPMTVYRETPLIDMNPGPEIDPEPGGHDLMDIDPPQSIRVG